MLEANLPAAGTHPVVITTTGNGDNLNGGALTIYKVRQQGPEATETNNWTDARGSIGTNVTTLTDGAWVIHVVGSGNSGGFTPGVGQTER